MQPCAQQPLRWAAGGRRKAEAQGWSFHPPFSWKGGHMIKGCRGTQSRCPALFISSLVLYKSILMYFIKDTKFSLLTQDLKIQNMLIFNNFTLRSMFTHPRLSSICGGRPSAWRNINSGTHSPQASICRTVSCRLLTKQNSQDHGQGTLNKVLGECNGL